MPRQISARQLAVQKSRPYATAGGIRKKIGSTGCKRMAGPSQSYQNVIRLSRTMTQTRLMPETSKTTRVNRHAENILATMGIGVVENIEIDPNPRSEMNKRVKLRSDFSLLKIETDTTIIPNSNIFDTKSAILKRGGVKFVRAADIIKTSYDSNEPFFKPDDQMNIASIQGQKASKVRKYTWAPSVLTTLAANQKRLPTKFMSPYFRIATRKHGTPDRRQSFDAVNL